MKNSTSITKNSTSTTKNSTSTTKNSTSKTAKSAANGFSAGTPWIYSEVVKEHFLNPRNFLMGDENKYPYDAKGIVGNPICGDQMLMFIQVEQVPNTKASDSKASNGPKPKTIAIIKDVKWKTYGCASAIASTSALSELAKGKSLDDALKISAEDIEKYLGGLPKHKFHCSVLGHEALAAAINDYRKNH